jgi:molecular chaperone GrpE
MNEKELHQEMEEAAENVAENQDDKESSSEEIAALQAEIAAQKDKYIRLLAEFDTYRRRKEKEKLELLKTAAQDTVTALLPVLDDFDRAKKSAEEENSTEQFSEGVSLVYKKLYDILRQLNLEDMNSTGQAFDPELHEAIAEIPAPSEELKGVIIDTVEKGYFLSGKIIRYAKVVIGK